MKYHKLSLLDNNHDDDDDGDDSTLCTCTSPVAIFRCQWQVQKYVVGAGVILVVTVSLMCAEVGLEDVGVAGDVDKGEGGEVKGIRGRWCWQRHGSSHHSGNI